MNDPPDRAVTVPFDLYRRQLSKVDSLKRQVESLQAQLSRATRELADARTKSFVEAQRESFYGPLSAPAAPTEPTAPNIVDPSTPPQTPTTVKKSGKKRSPPSADKPLPTIPLETRSSSIPANVPGEDTLPLRLEEYRRYGRQLILPSIGLDGQLKIKNSAVLVIGAGGLGCPAVAYLAGAGVGRLGIVDGDVVDSSNLHRQILHSTRDVGRRKVDSIRDFVAGLNPLVKVETYPEHLSPATALSIIAEYDLVLDCTDTPASRYLISDSCILSGKTLVSASALRTDGQLIVLNFPPAPPGKSSTQGHEPGPCYRCVWPVPPPPEAQTTCGEGGILGPVVGVMGLMMALEAVKVLTSPFHAPSNDAVERVMEDYKQQIETEHDPAPPKPTMLLFTALSTPPFRSVRLRSRRDNCVSCSAAATITTQSLQLGLTEYNTFCQDSLQLLRAEEQVSPRTSFAQLASTSPISADESHSQPLLVDVRERSHFDVWHHPDSINVPFSTVETWKTRADVVRDLGLGQEHHPSLDDWPWLRRAWRDIHVICRLGNDSQVAVHKMQELGLDEGGARELRDVKGGWKKWREEVAGAWPEV